jgi:hypothetical protein
VVRSLVFAWLSKLKFNYYHHLFEQATDEVRFGGFKLTEAVLRAFVAI